MSASIGQVTATGRIVIGYGSESGNSQHLAQRLAQEPFMQALGERIELQELGMVDPHGLGVQDRLIIITSSFGDGEPPANASDFLDAVRMADVLHELHYAIFGLGDTAYPTFCGFSKDLDETLESRAATAFVNRVDADSSYEVFFPLWRETLFKVLQGDAKAGKALNLRVMAYSENNSYPAVVVQRETLNRRAPLASHLRLDISGSGMFYRPGDTLYVVPDNPPELIERILFWLEPDASAQPLPDDRNRTALAGRELRQLGRASLRELARLSGNEELKELLKISQKKQLDAYLYGRDVLDVLQDFCSPDTVHLNDLVRLLPECLPRAYSIASSDPDHIDLCVRDVAYHARGRDYQGIATGHLGHVQVGDTLGVFTQSNPSFHLPTDTAPLILVGTGVGIAPFIGFLAQLEQAHVQGQPIPHTSLFFGDRHADSDFLYRERLEQWQGQGILQSVVTAFSRGDSPTDAGAQASDTSTTATPRRYVQHAMLEHADSLWALLSNGARVYVCGNKAYLGQAVEQALHDIARQSGGLDDEQAHTFVQNLLLEQRVKHELF